jgi:hypothetical protein
MYQWRSFCVCLSVEPLSELIRTFHFYFTQSISFQSRRGGGENAFSRNFNEFPAGLIVISLCTRTICVCIIPFSVIYVCIFLFFIKLILQYFVLYRSLLSKYFFPSLSLSLSPCTLLLYCTYSSDVMSY